MGFTKHLLTCAALIKEVTISTLSYFRHSLWVFGLVLLTSCASLSHRPYSCANTSDLFGYSIIAGFLFQVGDCAPFQSLHIETGDYYRANKDKIDSTIKTSDLASKADYEVLNRFALSYNCPKDKFREFSRVVIENRESIFSKNFSNSARKVSLEIIKLIHITPSLNDTCLK